LHRLGPVPHTCCLPWLVIGWLSFTGIDGQAGPLVTTDSPIGFFTNVAARLLQSQLGISLNNIQLYPTNQYAPSVHRLLQVTANLYDAATNRTNTAYPYLPSVFRPIFANQSAGDGSNFIFISGFQEVTDTSVLLATMRDLQLASDRAALQPMDMIYGQPLVIGAKKGFPNFNEFAMQTQVQVARKLQFHRQGDSTTAPVNEIDQMFVVGISNVFGVEAWNSYSNSFPRDLLMVVLPDLSVLVTNLETGNWLDPALAYYQPPATTVNIASNIWTGFDPEYPSPSFQIPLFTNVVFLTNSAYSQALDQFVPLTGAFERTPGTTNFYVPQWQLCLKIRLCFALIDSGRIVDYVNLTGDYPLNITEALMTGSQECGSVYLPDGSYGGMWCTERLNGAITDSTPTYGILNQIYASLGDQLPNLVWNSGNNDFPPGMGRIAAINFFNGQFLPPGYYPMTSNTFDAPYQPFRNIYLVTSWQANDPLVHYMLSDLPSDPTLPPNPVFDTPPTPLPLPNLGAVNNCYEPWGGNPDGSSYSTTAFDLTVKDPLVFGSDYWDFPTNPLPDLTWLGRVHRGTPWQTIYLKAPGTSLATWMEWTGDTQLVTNWDGVTGVTEDAFFTQPTNDWRLASLLISLLNTNDPRTLASVNQPGVSAWCGLLDGMTVLTNTDIGQLDPVIMSSNSPQAATIAAALDAMRSAQPNQTFRSIGDILAVPELSVASPWLDLSSGYEVEWSLTDEAYEAIPSQLLPLLRPDSIGSVSQSGGTLQVQFTGADGYAYTVQTSSNLLNWTAITTNYPVNGSFTFVDTPSPGSPRRFYRSLLWP
jgi:hypothetical protein